MASRSPGPMTYEELELAEFAVEEMFVAEDADRGRPFAERGFFSWPLAPVAETLNTTNAVIMSLAGRVGYDGKVISPPRFLMVVRTPQYIAVRHQACNAGYRPIQTRNEGPKPQSGEYTKPYVGESLTVFLTGRCPVYLRVITLVPSENYRSYERKAQCFGDVHHLRPNPL